MYTITKNAQFNSLEISFDSVPSAAVREALKALRFRWHNIKRVWYGYTTEAEVKAAIDGAGDPAPIKAEPAATVNKFGVKVGDLFRASWGYEQTNNDFFQVVALVGDSSVRVREVYPVVEDATATCWAAEDRVVCTNTNGVILPPAETSVFIKDQEKGDVKRLKSFAADGKSNPQFKLSSFASAYYCGGDSVKVYESWYA